MSLFALEQDEAVKACEQPKSVPDFRIFYDENATSEQIDAELDQITAKPAARKRRAGRVLRPTFYAFYL